MTEIQITTIVHLLGAVLAGGIIGAERSYHGRPAGFRTHSLVCIASSLLMLLTVYQIELLPNLPLESIRIDPTRMAQGIMTGIGFLGAGVIMREKLTIRGLTTAASIWMTASIGILIGVGFYFAAAVSIVLTLGALSVFRWIESRLPVLSYARLEVRTRRQDKLSLDSLRKLALQHGCTHANPSYRLEQDGKYFGYEVTLRTRDRENYRRLAESLSRNRKIPEFHIHPASD
ncbi:MAG: MgtC/SapB family protein [Pseudomonadota bacterium]